MLEMARSLDQRLADCVEDTPGVTRLFSTTLFERLPLKQVFERL